MELTFIIEKTVNLFQENPLEDDDTIISKLIAFGVDEKLAANLVNFITSAFCRAMYENSEINFKYFYLFHNGKGKLSEPQLFIDEPIFACAYKIAKSQLPENIASDYYLAVASRDAEYKVIHQFIENGSELRNVELSPICIYNPDYFYSIKKWWEIWK